MSDAGNFPFDDLQGLVRFGHGQLTESRFLLLMIKDARAAGAWLADAPVSNAEKIEPKPETALQIAFSAPGLRVLGLNDAAIDDFSDEFIIGMAGDDSRSRRLGDVGDNAPNDWQWGGVLDRVPHVLLMLYAKPGGLPAWRARIETPVFHSAFTVQSELPTDDLGGLEPFGFADGISQPKIDWARQQTTDKHARDAYSNLLAVGEVVLGYPNEYGQYTVRPLLDPRNDPAAAVLPEAEDRPGLRDFARNGSYLVLRQLGQDVPGFWRFIDQAGGSVATKREELAEAMVGRRRDGSPLVAFADHEIPGIALQDRLNYFDFTGDPLGQRCPVGAHIRRANPRTGDMPSPSGCFFARLIKLLGFGLTRHDEDLIASSRFHRLLRRGRPYGPWLTPEDAIKPDAPEAERGLQFICLVANIGRQFEFVQNAWVTNSKFAGLQQERDPLLAHREALQSGAATDQFHRPDPAGPARQYAGLPQFITVRGGAYFFMPGLGALRYLAVLNGHGR